jgi:hypothetical protein
MTPEQLILRAETAKRFLNDPLMVESLERLERDIMEAWARTGIRDREGQHELLLMIQTARKFKAIFTEIVMTGELQKQQIQAPKLTRVLERFGIYNP